MSKFILNFFIYHIPLAFQRFYCTHMLILINLVQFNYLINNTYNKFH
jgi:hypothetical protein